MTETSSKQRVLRCPDYLKNQAKEWRAIVSQLAAKSLLLDVDQSIIEAHVIAIGNLRRFQKALDLMSDESLGCKDSGAARLMAGVREATQAVNATAMQLGLSPLGRKRVALANPTNNPKGSPLEPAANDDCTRWNRVLYGR